MEQTGIIRRIDDLGRVVIPKQLRKDLGVEEGDPVELYIDRECREIVIRKYEPEEVTSQ